MAEAELNLSITTGKLLPTVNAFGAYLDQYGYSPSYQEANWLVGANLNLPIFDRSLYADRERDQLLVERARQRLAAVDNQLRLELTTTIAALANAADRMETTQRTIEQAEESFRIEQERYKLDSGVITDLLLAQAAAITTTANHNQALFDYTAATVAYRKATGALEGYCK